MTAVGTKKEEPSSSALSTASKEAIDKYPSGSSVISIADLLSLVNSEYQKYIPKKRNGSAQKYSVDDNNGIDAEGLEAVKHDLKQMQHEKKEGVPPSDKIIAVVGSKPHGKTPSTDRVSHS